MNLARAVGRTIIAAGLGAVVSQAVALLCSLNAGSTSLGGRPLTKAEMRLPAFLRGIWPEPDEGSAERGLTIGHSNMTLRCPIGAPPDFRNEPPKYGLYMDAFGWPARSLVSYRSCVFTSNGNGGQIDLPAFFRDFEERAGLAHGVPRPAWWPRSKRTGDLIPVWPLWPGLGLNAALYGGAVVSAVVIPGRVRRARRRARGRCVDCGYDLVGLDSCPECGTPAEYGRETRPHAAG